MQKVLQTLFARLHTCISGMVELHRREEQAMGVASRKKQGVTCRISSKPAGGKPDKPVPADPYVVKAFTLLFEVYTTVNWGGWTDRAEPRLWKCLINYLSKLPPPAN
jgi:hypothetical protein